MTALHDRIAFAEGGQADGPLPDGPAGWSQPEPKHSAATAANVPPLVRASRAVTVAITAGIAITSFILSFAALSDLARRTGSWAGWLPYLWPGIVDGAIILATMGILATAALTDQRESRQFFWAMLSTGTLVSMGETRCTPFFRPRRRYQPGWRSSLPADSRFRDQTTPGSAVKISRGAAALNE